MKATTLGFGFAVCSSVAFLLVTLDHSAPPTAGGDGRIFDVATEAQLRGIVRTGFDTPRPTGRQIERRKRTIALLRSLGAPLNERLPHVEDERNLELRAPQDVARRTFCLGICALKGETQDQEACLSVMNRSGVKAFLSRNERLFLLDQTPEHQDLIDNAWGYECAHVLLWGLGHVERLAPPNRICNVASEMGLLGRFETPQALAKAAQPRRPNEIVEALDQYYNFHWAAVEMHRNGDKAETIDPSIVRERYRALNWLVRHLNRSWDDVRTDA